MKYLKTYNESTKNPDALLQEAEFAKKAEEEKKVLSSIKSDVEDILLEVSDEGFYTQVSINRWHRNEPFFTYARSLRGLQDGWLSEMRYSMIINIVKDGLKPGQPMLGNTNYFDINTIKEPLIRLEGYVKDNLPGYKMEYDNSVDKAWKENRISKISLVTITIDNYHDGVLPPNSPRYK